MPGILNEKLIVSSAIDKQLIAIAKKVNNQQRITDDEAVLLFEKPAFLF